MCYGGETETSAPVEPSSRSARKRRMEIHQFNFVPADMAVLSPDNCRKRQKLEINSPVSPPFELESCVQNCEASNNRLLIVDDESETKCLKPSPAITEPEVVVKECSKFGLTSVCGRRRDMEDAVAVYPSFSGGKHFYGVYDGHGCSHVNNFIHNFR